MKIAINQTNVLMYNSQLEEALDRYIEFCVETDDVEYRDYLKMARWVRENYHTKIALHILNFANVEYFLSSKPVYPGMVKHSLYYIRDYVFNGFTSTQTPLTLEQQNEKSRNYIHFDFSVKKVKTISDITPVQEVWTTEEIMQREG